MVWKLARLVVIIYSKTWVTVLKHGLFGILHFEVFLLRELSEFGEKEGAMTFVYGYSMLVDDEDITTRYGTWHINIYVHGL